LSDVFFDTDGIAHQHHSTAEKEGLRALGEDLHPLAILTNNVPVYNADGINMSPEQWMSKGIFNLKDWMYALFYGARFVSWHELAEYLMLGEYDLIEKLKTNNFNHLAHIQPALEFQKVNNIP